MTKKFILCQSCMKRKTTAAVKPRKSFAILNVQRVALQTVIKSAFSISFSRRTVSVAHNNSHPHALPAKIYAIFGPKIFREDPKKETFLKCPVQSKVNGVKIAVKHENAKSMPPLSMSLTISNTRFFIAQKMRRNFYSLVNTFTFKWFINY